MTQGTISATSRRALIRSLGALPIATVAGCLDNDGPTAADELGVDPSKLTDIRFTQWPGAFREAAAVAYVEPFESAAGITVNLFDHPTEADALPDLVIAGQHTFDLMSHWNYTLPRGIDAGAFQPLRTEHIPQLETVSEQFDPATVDYDPGDAIHHVPYSLGGNVIVYNAEKIDEPETWDRLLDDDLAGEVWMPRTPSMIMGMLCRQAGLELDEVEGNEAQIWDLIDQYNEVVDHWWTDPSALDAALADGRVTAAGYWSGRAYALQENGHPIDFCVPEEGTNAWIEVLSIPEDVSDPARRTAEAIMNYAMQPDSIIDFADEIGYAVAYDLTEAAIPDGHIYQDHPTWDEIGTGTLDVWNADIIARNESAWDAELESRTE